MLLISTPIMSDSQGFVANFAL